MLRIPATLLAALLIALLPASLSAQTYAIGAGQAAPIAPDGRVLGHIPYGEASRDTLVSAPPGFGVGQPCLLNRDVIPDLARLIAAQRASGVGGTIHGISCYRTIEHQRAVFCGAGKRCRDAVIRARAVGPPAHSEHSTGYALDFGVRPSGGCADVDDCIAATPAGRWLIANAPSFGFELSFPAGNAQGVTWEPWHWRWVGVNGDSPDAARARTLFARARSEFPASPAILPLVIRVTSQPPVPITIAPPSPLPPALPKMAKKPKRR